MHAIPLIAALLLPLVSVGQDKCTEQGKAEQQSIEREFTAKRPAKGDKDAELTWSKNLYAALAASAKRAEDCTRANRPAATPAATAKLEECLADVRRRTDELQQRYRGRTPTLQEQKKQRDEEARLQDEYQACSKAARR
jgi:hypothetical protein